MSLVIIGFKADYANGKQVDWVQVAPKGEGVDKVQTWHRVRDLMPKTNVDEAMRDSPHYQAMLARWEQIEPAYKAWREGEAIPETGVPLSAWSGVTADQVEFLKRMHIRTVEDVADMKDREISAMPFPNARKLPEMAKAFLDSRSASEKDAEMAALREKMAVMEEMLAERLDAEAPAKRGPGRPRKAPAEVAEEEV